MEEEKLELDFEEDFVEKEDAPSAPAKPVIGVKATVKRLSVVAPLSVRETEQKTSAERQAARFGIQPVKRIEVGQDDLDALYEDLRVDVDYTKHSTRTVLVKGVDGMTKFAVEKIFAAFHPYRVEMADDVTALVHFATKGEAGAMFVQMTKSLRRIRCQKKADEEGEVLSSDDEDGQLKQEGGDDVAVVTKIDQKPRHNKSNSVEVDVDAINIPDGRWRVVTEHVPEKRLLLARFATTDEILEHRQRRSIPDSKMSSEERKRRLEDNSVDGYSYKWSTDEKVRPGLNIFDKDGNELDWDYEHDTRFFDEASPAGSKETPKDDVTKGAPQAVKVRGRGSKKGRFLYGGGSTLASDVVEEKPKKHVDLDDPEEDEERDDDFGPNLDPSPTPQPWDRRSRLANRLTRDRW